MSLNQQRTPEKLSAIIIGTANQARHSVASRTVPAEILKFQNDLIFRNDVKTNGSFP